MLGILRGTGGPLLHPGWPLTVLEPDYLLWLPLGSGETHIFFS